MVLLNIDEWIFPFKEEVKRMTIDVDVDQILNLIKQIDRKFSTTDIITRLRRKPKRATKFSIKIKSLINWIKLVSKNLSPETQTELYSAFGLLLQHYINIVLISSVATKGGSSRVKERAQTMIGYVKLVLDGEPEFTLDVVLSSNAKHRSQNHEHSLGFFLLHVVLADSPFYAKSLDDVDIFTKILAVGKFLAKSDKRIYGLDTQEIVEYIPAVPKQLYNLYRQKKSGHKQRLDKSQIVTLLLKTAKSNNVAKMSKERLAINLDQGGDDNGEDNDINSTNLILFSDNNTVENNDANDIFFMDTVGNEGLMQGLEL